MADASSRESGFYWVNWLGNWEVAQWYQGVWLIAGLGDNFKDSDFQEIGERVERTS